MRPRKFFETGTKTETPEIFRGRDLDNLSILSKPRPRQRPLKFLVTETEISENIVTETETYYL